MVNNYARLIYGVHLLSCNSQDDVEKKWKKAVK